MKQDIINAETCDDCRWSDPLPGHCSHRDAPGFPDRMPPLMSDLTIPAWCPLPDAPEPQQEAKA